MTLSIGVLADCLQREGIAGIKKAVELGAEVVQFYVTRGELDGEAMTTDTRHRLEKVLDSKGIRISAFCGDLGMGFLNPQKTPEALHRTMAYMDLASQMGVPVVTSHIGWLPEDPSDPAWRTGLDSLRQLSACSLKTGVIFASETGAEPAERLARFLEELDAPGIRINFDPANFHINGTGDPIKSFQILSRWVVHTHAKDARKTAGGRGSEVPIGEGDVDFPALLAAYRQAGYTGPLVIEREGGENRDEEIRSGIEYLKRLVSS